MIRDARRRRPRAGLDPADLENWLAEPTPKRRSPRTCARADPTPAALALAHKLAPTRRRRAPLHVSVLRARRGSDGASLSAPGFQPTLPTRWRSPTSRPRADRRDDPSDVAEVLDWAGEPLATAEIAAVCEIGLDEAREQLGRVATRAARRRRRPLVTGAGASRVEGLASNAGASAAPRRGRIW